MKFPLKLFLSTLMLLTIGACANPLQNTDDVPPFATIEQTDSKIFGVFEGITPCSNLARPLPQIPQDTDCEQMIWKFTLYQDASTGTPTTYELNAAYGVPQPNTTGLASGGTEIEMAGTWEIVKDPNAVVYQLNSGVPEDTVSFAKIGDDILHVLNKDGTLMVGNAGWSYTINRTDNRPHEYITNAGAGPVAETQLVIPTMPAGLSVLGVFEGRTPCPEIVFAFTGVPPYDRCIKIKWQLTLYQDDAGAPAGYLFRGTSTVRQGTWTIVQGTKEDPGAVVYQLRSDEGQVTMSFLKVGEDHLFLLDEDLNLLVGDALFSYTLSRTE
jgi:hypothetical protein